jgi:hypothetical protein
MTTGAISTTSFAAAMKKIYPQKRVELIFYKHHPLMAKMAKAEDFYGFDQGGTMAIAVQSGAPSGGRSATFGNAQANISAGNDERFNISRKTDYQLWKLNNEVIEASSRDVGAIMRVLQNKGDAALLNLSRNLAAMLYGNGGGARGRGNNAAPVGTTIVLANPGDIVFFERDMVLVASDVDGSGTNGVIRGPGGGAAADTALVTGVDRSAGSFTVNAIPASWGNQDYYFQQGDVSGLTTGAPGLPAAVTGNVVTGLAGWIPTTAPVAGVDNFFGLDRGVDPTRLAGSRFNGIGLPIEESLKRISTLIVRNGGRPDTVFLNPIDYERLELSLEGRARFETMTTQVGGKRSATVGFDSMVITTTAGKANVFADVNCPQGSGYMLQMDTWKFHHLKGCPHMITQGAGAGGGRMVNDNDQVEFRSVYRGNLACTAPGYNGVVQL